MRGPWRSERRVPRSSGGAAKKVGVEGPSLTVVHKVPFQSPIALRQLSHACVYWIYTQSQPGSFSYFYTYPKISCGSAIYLQVYPPPSFLFAVVL